MTKDFKTLYKGMKFMYLFSPLSCSRS